MSVSPRPRIVPDALGAGSASSTIPPGLDIAVAWAIRLVVLGVSVYMLFQALAFFSLVTIPVGVGILLAALLEPMVRLLQRLCLPRLVATIVSLVVSVLALGGVFTLVGIQAMTDAPKLVAQTMTGVRQLLDWLAVSPLHVSSDLGSYVTQVQAWLQGQASSLATSAAGIGAYVGNLFGGTLTAVMAAFFFLADGDRIAEGIGAWLIPDGPEARIFASARKGWASLVSYMRATLIVCFASALFVAIAAVVLGVPMAMALFALTFLAFFVPIIGPAVAGVVAVVLALVSNGWVGALLMLAAYAGINVLTVNILQPILMGKAVPLHPLITMLGLTAGGVVAGVTGIVLAIPIMAFFAAFANAMRWPDSVPDDPGPPEDTSEAGEVTPARS